MKRIAYIALITIFSITIFGCGATSNNNVKEPETGANEVENVDNTIKNEDGVYCDEYHINIVESSEYKVIDYFDGQYPLLDYDGRSGKATIYLLVDSKEEKRMVYSDENIDVYTFCSYYNYTGAKVYDKSGNLIDSISFIDDVNVLFDIYEFKNGDILNVDLNSEKMKEMGYISNIQPFKIKITKLPEFFTKGDEINFDKLKNAIIDYTDGMGYDKYVNDITIKNVLLTECVDENNILEEVYTTMGKVYNIFTVSYDIDYIDGYSGEDLTNMISFYNFYETKEKYEHESSGCYTISNEDDIKTYFENHFEHDGYESEIVY